MKKTTKGLSPILSALLLGASVTAHADASSVCPSTNVHASGAALDAIKQYKNSPHTIMIGYWRTWGDVANDPSNTSGMSDLPDCVDIAVVFSDYTVENFWKVLHDSYVPTLHRRGTKVIQTVGVSQLTDSSYPNTPEGYQALAQHLMDNVVNANHLDGIDVDVESILSGPQLQQATGVFHALSQYLGPKSGTDKLLVMDTNLNGSMALYKNVSGDLNYVFEQTYGRSVSTMQGTLDSYLPSLRPNQFANSADMEGDGWNDFTTPLNLSRAYALATWQPSTPPKAGFFIYGIDVDGPDFPTTIALMAAMNP